MGFASWFRLSFFVLVLGGPVTSAFADEVRVFATGVFASSLRDLTAPFKAATGHVLTITVANAGGIATKVQAGEAADVVMSSSAGIDGLVRQGKLVAPSKVDVGRMRLGVGVRAGTPKPDITSPDQLRTLLLAASAVAYIDPHGGATAGAFFEKVFETLGVADAVHAKAILCTDGSEVDAALAAGRANIGMTQASEIIGAPGVTFAGFLPETLNAATVYSAAFTTMSAHPQAAAAFLQFLNGPLGAASLRRAGWTATSPAP